MVSIAKRFIEATLNMISRNSISKILSKSGLGAMLMGISLIGAAPAQASLQGTVIFGAEAGGGVLFTGFGLTSCDIGLGTDPIDGGCNPITSFDFLNVPLNPDPNFGTPGDGNVTNSLIFEGSDDFAQFVGSAASIKDLPDSPGESAPGDINDFPPPTTVDFIVVPGDGVPGFELDITSALGIPTYAVVPSPGGAQTSVSVGLGGLLYKTDETGMRTDDDPSIFEGIISVNFAGLGAPDDIRELFDEEGEEFGPIGYTITLVASKPVPESSSVVSLLGLGLAGAASLAMKRKS